MHKFFVREIRGIGHPDPILCDNSIRQIINFTSIRDEQAGNAVGVVVLIVLFVYVVKQIMRNE